MFFNTYSEMLNDMIDGLKRENIQGLSGLIEETRNDGKHLFVPGSGGSAAAASHWVCDFDKRTSKGDSKRLKIFSPTDNEAIFSTPGNDCRYETAFVKQIKNFLEPGGLALTFPVSGSLSDLVEARQYAKEIGVKTTCVVADKGGKIIGTSGFATIISSENYGVIENIHIILGHTIL